MSLGTLLFTWLHGELVGTDEFANRYFRDKRTRGAKRERRWVLYKGEVEASRVPPEWHAWLHATIALPPLQGAERQPWQLAHEPNLTGTDQAYRPPGHVLKGGKRQRATGDYEPWSPE